LSFFRLAGRYSKRENDAGHCLQPVAGVDANRPCLSTGGLYRARRTRLLPLRQGLLPRACFPGVAAYACDSGFYFGPESIAEPRAGHVGLDFTGRPYA